MKTFRSLAFCLASVLLIACFATSCQPITSEPDPTTTSSPGPAPTLASEVSYQAPSVYKDAFKAQDDRISFDINADVIVPDAAQIPVLQITPQDISVDLIKKAAVVLMEGKTMYEPRATLTKAQLQAQIDTIQNILDVPQSSHVEGLNYNDPSIAISAANALLQSMDIYRLMYQDAPDAYTPKEAAFQYHNQAYYYQPAAANAGGDPVGSASASAVPSATAEEKTSGEDVADTAEDHMKNSKTMIVQADLDGGYYGNVTASNYSGKSIQYNVLSFHKSRFMDKTGNVTVPGQDIFMQPCTISQDEAYRMALDLLNRLGISDMSLSTCRPAGIFSELADPQAKDVYGYYVEFFRSYNQIPLISFSDDYNSFTNEYNHPAYSYESVSIMIHEDQITSFSWQSPSGPVQIIDQNASLLPFNKILDIFKRQAAETYGAEKLTQCYKDQSRYNVGATFDQILEGFQTGQINISKIELGYVRTEDEAQPGSYLLTLAWKFYGSDQAASRINGTTNVYPGRLPNAVNTYLTINAVDGSIMDGMFVNIF